MLTDSTTFLVGPNRLKSFRISSDCNFRCSNGDGVVPSRVSSGRPTLQHARSIIRGLKSSAGICLLLVRYVDYITNRVPTNPMCQAHTKLVGTFRVRSQRCRA